MLLLFSFVLFVQCKEDNVRGTVSVNSPIQFKQISPSKSGIDFANNINEFDPQVNYFSYFQIYQGSGVAAGDFNDDGLLDLFFQSSQLGGSLYKNNGGLKFEKMDLPKDLFNLKAFGNGVSLVDINADGLLDIYLCYGGPPNQTPTEKANRLLLNKGNFQFQEVAQEYGLANTDNSSHASFFDYDRDGDLDLYLVNTNTNRNDNKLIVIKESLSFDSPTVTQKFAQDRLYKNTGHGKFEDVTRSSGLMPELFYGFNASISDFNLDGWPDVYVTNDFYNPDFLYINNQDGTFTESLLDYFKHSAYNSMGSDVGDINNDGLEDLIVADMWPEDYIRSREQMGMTNPKFVEAIIENGYGHQYMHNMLQLNSGLNRFQEIGQYAGITKTDWSWAVLIDDFNNDGFKDLFVSNGIYRDIGDNDARISRTQYINSKGGNVTEQELKELVNRIPSVPLSNYLFVNNQDLTFKDISKSSGLGYPSFSQGAVSADLDNDGDLDLVINNVNEPAFLLENSNPKENFVQFEFSGKAKNTFGIGTRVCIYYDDQQQCSSLNLSRGYMSSSPTILHFGLGEIDQIDRVELIWPNGSSEEKSGLTINQKHKIEQSTSAPIENKKKTNPIFSKHKTKVFAAHQENKYADFEEQVLLPHSLSDLGPALAKGDLNKDGLDDLFIGGGQGQPGAIYLGNKNGEFQKQNSDAFKADQSTEDTDAHFFDFNQDGHLDLVVASGSYEFEEGSEQLGLRLYINSGSGQFKKHNYGAAIKCNSMTVVSGDIDNDGDEDIFLAGRIVKNKYPLAPKSYLLINEGGKLIDKTEELSPELRSPGMITDAKFWDYDSDKDLDLVVVGEWMGVQFHENENGKYKLASYPQQEETKGWLNSITIEDLNQDGHEDIIIGNLGLNYKFKASTEKPFEVYANDFDTNGTFDVVLAKPIDNDLYPIRGKMCSTEQMPFIGDKYPTFASFARANMRDIYGNKLTESTQLKVNKFESFVLLNKGKGLDFDISDLPKEAQLSPIRTSLVKDFNSDGHLDILMAGNLLGAEVETTRADAGIGLLLTGNGQGKFQAVSPIESGFLAEEDPRKMVLLNNKAILLVNNSGSVEIYFNSQ